MTIFLEETAASGWGSRCLWWNQFLATTISRFSSWWILFPEWLLNFFVITQCILIFSHVSMQLPYPMHWFWSIDFFSKTCKFSILFYNFLGEATFEKYADPGKKNRNSRKSRANCQNLLEPFLRSRNEKNLYGHCAMNIVRRILSKGSTFLMVDLNPSKTKSIKS